jgi:hypothetical protein
LPLALCLLLCFLSKSLKKAHDDGPRRKVDTMATQEKSDHMVAAERLVKALPSAVRKKAEVEEGKGKYTLVKVGGRTVASVRSKNVRLTFGHDGTADSVAGLADALAEAAGSRPPVKTMEEREAEKKAKTEAKAEAAAKKKEEEEKAEAEAGEGDDE